MKKSIVLVLVLASFICGMLFMNTVNSEIPAAKATAVPEVTATPVAKATMTPKVTATPVAKATTTPKVTATPVAKATTIPKVTATPIAKATMTPVVEEKNNGPVTVQELFGGNKVKNINTVEIVDNNSTEGNEENEENIFTVQDLFGKGKKAEIKVAHVSSSEVNVFSEIEVKTSPMSTVNPVNYGAENKFLENGFQLCNVLLNRDGNIIAIENQYELKTRKQTLTSLSAVASNIIKVATPVENREDDRVNGRFVRSKKPHEVLVKDGQIYEGYSLVPLKLEVVDTQLLEELVGKPANEVTAQDIVASTVVVENHDGKWIAAHKSAPGYRGPLVAKLYLEDGRWLRVEKWNWTINEGDPKSIGIPSLVFVMCSDRGSRTPI